MRTIKIVIKKCLNEARGLITAVKLIRCNKVIRCNEDVLKTVLNYSLAFKKTCIIIKCISPDNNKFDLLTTILGGFKE